MKPDDPASPAGLSSPSAMEPPAASPPEASIPIASDPTEHRPLLHHPENHWQYGVNYGARRVRGFMCKTDWDFELGHAGDGNSIFPSIKALRQYRSCVDECGIVEVEVTLYRVHQWDAIGNYDPAQGIEAEGPRPGTGLGAKPESPVA